MASVVALIALAGCRLDSLVLAGDRVADYQLPAFNAVPPELLSLETIPSGHDTLYAYYLHQPGTLPRFTLLLSHGKGGNVTREFEWLRAQQLWQVGFDVIAYDYRGFGRSSGSTTGEASLEADASAALAFALAQRDVAIDNVVLYGHSIGATPTLALAVAHPGIRLVAIESAFSSGQEIARTATLLDIPVGWLVDGRFDNVGMIGQVNAPILIVHGAQDTQVPVADADTLFRHAHDPRLLDIVPGAGHNDVPNVQSESAISALFNQLLQ